MLWTLTRRLFSECDLRVLSRFGWNFCVKGLWAVQKFKRAAERGEHVPAFVIVSVTNTCNYRCQGCWVAVDAPRTDLAPEMLDRLIADQKRRGGRFFGLLGGEPLFYKPLWDLLARHSGCYFQVFTNGSLLTDEMAARMRQLGNVTPLISLEGRDHVADQRRGGRDVEDAAWRAIKLCRKNRLLTGVATSLCQSNFKQLLSEEFIDELIAAGVHYLWYYVYRPVGARPAPELALNAEQLTEARRFMVEARCRKPILIVDAYWDEEGRALCPAAVGLSHHISPWGDVEPCPVVQFAAENLRDGDLGELVRRSEFLREFRAVATAATRGCILLERPDLLRELVVATGARDSSGRGTALAELTAMQARPSHHLPGQEIPERHWLYRFAKKHWFFGFGAYG